MKKIESSILLLLEDYCLDDRFENVEAILSLPKYRDFVLPPYYRDLLYRTVAKRMYNSYQHSRKNVYNNLKDIEKCINDVSTTAQNDKTEELIEDLRIHAFLESGLLESLSESADCDRARVSRHVFRAIGEIWHGNVEDSLVYSDIEACLLVGEGCDGDLWRFMAKKLNARYTWKRFMEKLRKQISRFERRRHLKRSSVLKRIHAQRDKMGLAASKQNSLPHSVSYPIASQISNLLPAKSTAHPDQASPASTISDITPTADPLVEQIVSPAPTQTSPRSPAPILAPVPRLLSSPALSVSNFAMPRTKPSNCDDRKQLKPKRKMHRTTEKLVQAVEAARIQKINRNKASNGPSATNIATAPSTTRASNASSASNAPSAICGTRGSSVSFIPQTFELNQKRKRKRETVASDPNGRRASNGSSFSSIPGDAGSRSDKRKFRRKIRSDRNENNRHASRKRRRPDLPRNVSRMPSDPGTGGTSDSGSKNQASLKSKKTRHTEEHRKENTLKVTAPVYDDEFTISAYVVVERFRQLSRSLFERSERTYGKLHVFRRRQSEALNCYRYLFNPTSTDPERLMYVLYVDAEPRGYAIEADVACMGVYRSESQPKATIIFKHPNTSAVLIQVMISGADKRQLGVFLDRLWRKNGAWITKNEATDAPEPPSSPPFHESGEAERVRKNIKNERERNNRAHLIAKFDKLLEIHSVYQRPATTFLGDTQLSEAARLGQNVRLMEGVGSLPKDLVNLLLSFLQRCNCGAYMATRCGLCWNAVCGNCESKCPCGKTICRAWTCGKSCRYCSQQCCLTCVREFLCGHVALCGGCFSKRRGLTICCSRYCLACMVQCGDDRCEKLVCRLHLDKGRFCGECGKLARCYCGCGVALGLHFVENHVALCSWCENRRLIN